MESASTPLQEETGKKILDSVQLIGVSTQHARFFIPSKQNIFGGYRVEVCMFDTGCNSILLPLQDHDHLTKIMELFPTTGDWKYTWTVSSSNGVGTLNSPVLHVRYPDYADYVDKTIEITLSSDSHPFKMQVKSLRFHLCYEDTIGLQKLHNSGKVALNEASVRHLNSFIDTVTAIKTVLPSIQIGKRRRHALIGQDVLKKNPKMVCIQNGGVFYCYSLDNSYLSSLNSRELVNNATAVVTEYCENLVDKNWDRKEFENLEDDDHNNFDNDCVFRMNPRWDAIDENAMDL
eukprot:TRINITY_DN874_c0_g2_i1.p1 TRINITY_DN874_c0_g2~~TRINITY_DN874_c0_g2_i1.p1  ORF type:complete len:290 (+),score=8.04 TRINITY_DN874_c0_g2_i1:67-936(+)